MGSRNPIMLASNTNDVVPIVFEIFNTLGHGRVVWIIEFTCISKPVRFVTTLQFFSFTINSPNDKTAENDTTFKALFENILESYIMNRGVPDEMHSLEETVYNILIPTRRMQRWPVQKTSRPWKKYKILLLGMSIGERIGEGVAPSPSRRTVELVDQAAPYV